MMKNFLLAFLSALLIFVSVAPSVANAKINTATSGNVMVEEVNGSTVTTTETMTTRHVTMVNEEGTVEAMFNKITGELYVNGERMSEVIDVQSLKEFSEAINRFVSPLNNDPGDLGSYKLLVDVFFPIDSGSISAITFNIVFTIMTSVLGSTLRESIRSTLTSFIYSEMITQKMPKVHVALKAWAQNYFLTGNWVVSMWVYKDVNKSNFIFGLYDYHFY